MMLKYRLVAFFLFHPNYCTSALLTANTQKLILTVTVEHENFVASSRILRISLDPQKDIPQFISLDSSTMRFCKNLPPSGFSSLKTLKVALLE